MAYNPPPPGESPDGGFGGYGGIPGFFGGAFPGWATPYQPVTPLGSLWGFKGDLIVPIVVVGVALFIVLLVVFAVKEAFAFKAAALGGLAGAKGSKFTRDAPAPHLEAENLNRLADVVAAAIYSHGCSERILCDIGAQVRDTQQYTSFIRLLELIVPESYHASYDILRQSAEGKVECANNYPCGGSGPNSQIRPDVATNEINGSGPTAGFGATNQTSTGNATVSPNAATTPAPSIFNKFARSMHLD